MHSSLCATARGLLCSRSARGEIFRDGNCAILSLLCALPAGIERALTPCGGELQTIEKNLDHASEKYKRNFHLFPFVFPTKDPSFPSRKCIVFSALLSSYHICLCDITASRPVQSAAIGLDLLNGDSLRRRCRQLDRSNGPIRLRSPPLPLGRDGARGDVQPPSSGAASAIKSKSTSKRLLSQRTRL